MGPALERLCEEAEQAVRRHNILILSDRNTNADNIADPGTAGDLGGAPSPDPQGPAHQLGLVVETGAALEVHHFATLAGYGAEAINPYLAFDTIQSLLPRHCRGRQPEEAQSRYIKAVGKGLKKVMSKMGISHLPVLLRRADLRCGRPEQPRVRRATSPAPRPRSRASA
jgi:glutamate synthase (NADPH/NADH) large chain